MTFDMCRIPAEIGLDIESHAQDVARFLKGELSASILKSRRVPRGIYEQRQNGTYMVRVRLPGGTMTAAQARAIAAAASRYGSGVLHMTTRQDIQIHDVKIEQTPDVMRDLFKAGLTSKGGGGNTVRNITSCHYAGICPAERFDVTPCVIATTEYLIGLAGSYNLPRKYKIAFSGCGADCALARVNDLGFIASVRNGKQGFRVYAGGGMGAESRLGDLMEDWVPAGDVIRIAEAVRRLFDRLGNRRNRRQARLRFAVEKIGADAFRGMLRETVEAATGDGTPECHAVGDVAANPVCPRGDYRSLLTRSGNVEVLKQHQAGYVAVPLRLPLGQVKAAVLEALAGLADRFSSEKMLRATQDQNLLLRFVRESDIGALKMELDRITGPESPGHAVLHSFTACTGSAICRLGLCLSQNAARACADSLSAAGLEQATLNAVDIRINGCPNACGQHPIGTIGLFGAAHRVGSRLVPAYRVLLGARRGEEHVRMGEFAGVVPARALPGFLADLLRDFEAVRSPSESFADYYDRLGISHFQSMINRHGKAPSHEDCPEFYRDWGRDDDFTLAGRGPGECGAGVFEVIAEDLLAATRAMESAGDGSEQAEAFYRGLLSTARALLITRGLDTMDPAAIFRSFETHFVDTGLVDAGFRSLLARGRGYGEGWREALAGMREEILRLHERVSYLYSTMDADLRFHVSGEEGSCAKPPEAPAPARAGAGSGITADVEIDLRGVACPMNFVKAKLKLEMMDAGAALAVILDDGEPVQNVPASFRNEGQEILETSSIGGGHWRVVVRKKKG